MKINHLVHLLYKLLIYNTIIFTYHGRHSSAHQVSVSSFGGAPTSHKHAGKGVEVGERLVVPYAARTQKPTGAPVATQFRIPQADRG